MNYIEKLGRMAEVKGESALYDDLLNRLVLDSAGAVADYNRSPAWLKQLLNAYADGINYYLYKHPDAKPALLQRFKPWYHLLWTDGSILYVVDFAALWKWISPRIRSAPLRAFGAPYSIQDNH